MSTSDTLEKYQVCSGCHSYRIYIVTYVIWLNVMNVQKGILFLLDMISRVSVETGLGCYMVLCFLVTLPSVSTCCCT